MPVTVNSSIVIGVRKDTISASSDKYKIGREAEEKIAHYFKEVGLSVEDAGWFFLMEKHELDSLKYTADYYHMERKLDYVDSGDPDLTETDPFDDEVLQFFIKNITKKETFDCFVTSEELKLYSHLTGETDFEEEKPIPLKDNQLILLRCCLYY